MRSGDRRRDLGGTAVTRRDARAGEIGFDQCGLVFDFRDAAAVEAAAAVLLHGEGAETGMESVRRYLAPKPPGARLTPLFPDLAGRVVEGANWKLVVPAPTSPLSPFPLIYLLRLTQPGDERGLAEKLGTDPRIKGVHRPASYHPLLPPDRGWRNHFDLHRWLGRLGGAKLARWLRQEWLIRFFDPQWGLRTCGFDKVWDQLERGPEPRPIGVIDAGSVRDHPELRGRVTNIPPVSGAPQVSAHALTVAGVIASIRDGTANEKMLGCCSAKLRVYNVFNEDGFDCESFYRALKQVADDCLPVVNLSVGSETEDPLTELLVRHCICQGVVIVAAMGDLFEKGNPPVYPAAIDGVIAVGGTNSQDERSKTSGTGRHICISAPSERILTLDGFDDYDCPSGTSYATAIVSAAVWLARRRCSKLNPHEVRLLLERSATGSGKHTCDRGFGRLDMVKLAELLKSCT